VQSIVASGRAILEDSSLPEGSRFSKPYSDHAIVDAIADMLSNGGSFAAA
jgi:hypothetical protein